jgi:hypothetical protein
MLTDFFRLGRETEKSMAQYYSGNYNLPYGGDNGPSLTQIESASSLAVLTPYSLPYPNAWSGSTSSAMTIFDLHPQQGANPHAGWEDTNAFHSCPQPYQLLRFPYHFILLSPYSNLLNSAITETWPFDGGN